MLRLLSALRYHFIPAAKCNFNTVNYEYFITRSKPVKSPSSLPAHRFIVASLSRPFLDVSTPSLKLFLLKIHTCRSRYSYLCIDEISEVTALYRNMIRFE